MAAKQDTHFPVHMHCIQHSRFTKQDGWRLLDLSLSLSGNIAVTGGNKNTHRTSLDVYSPVRNSDSRDKPKIFYSKEFDIYESQGRTYWLRYISFVDSYDDNRGLVVVTGLGDKLEVFDLNQDGVLKTRKVTLVNPGGIRCLSVGEREIFIGFKESNKITLYDVTDLNEIKSIILQGFQDGYWPGDITAVTDRLFVCEGKPSEESNHRSLIFDKKNGKILSELTKPTDTCWYTISVTVSVPLGVVAVVWFDSWYKREGECWQIVFDCLFSPNNSSFLIVEIESGVNRIRISDRGDRMVTMNEWTGEVKVYDMAEFFTYSQLKENLTSQLQIDECLRLANFFDLPKDQTDATLKTDKPTDNFVHALEEKCLLQPANVDRLAEAFTELKISSSCNSLVNFYQNTRTSTFYKRTIQKLQEENTVLQKQLKQPQTSNVRAESTPPEAADLSPDSVSSPPIEYFPDSVVAQEFSKLLVKVSVNLSNDNCVLLAIYFNFPEAKIDEIGKGVGSPGIALLRVMKERNIINMYDVTSLQKALIDIELRGINESLLKPYQRRIDPAKYQQNRVMQQ